MRLIATGAVILMLNAASASSAAEIQVRTANGVLEGTAEEGGIRLFRSVPFAEPPVGDLRWKPPQPPKDWDGVRRADKFGPRPMQPSLFGDMNFRSERMG